MFEYYKTQPYYKDNYFGALISERDAKISLGDLINNISADSGSIAILKNLLTKPIKERKEIIEILIKEDAFSFENDQDKEIEDKLSDLLQEYKKNRFIKLLKEESGQEFNNDQLFDLIIKFLFNDESHVKKPSFDEKKAEEEFKALALVKIIEEQFREYDDFFEKLLEYDKNKIISNNLGIDLNKFNDYKQEKINLEKQIDLKNKKIETIKNELKNLERTYGQYEFPYQLYDKMKKDFRLEEKKQIENQIKIFEKDITDIKKSIQEISLSINKNDQMYDFVKKEKDQDGKDCYIQKSERLYKTKENIEKTLSEKKLDIEKLKEKLLEIDNAFNDKKQELSSVNYLPDEIEKDQKKIDELEREILNFRSQVLQLYDEKIRSYDFGKSYFDKELVQKINLIKDFFDEKIKKFDVFNIESKNSDIVLKKLDASQISQEKFLSQYNLKLTDFFEINFDDLVLKSSILISRIIFNSDFFGYKIENSHYLFDEHESTKEVYKKPESLVIKNFKDDNNNLSILNDILNQNSLIYSVRILLNNDNKTDLEKKLRDLFEKKDRFILLNLQIQSEDKLNNEFLAFNVKEENLGLTYTQNQNLLDKSYGEIEEKKNLCDLLYYLHNPLKIYSAEPQSIIDALKNPKNGFKSKLSDLDEIFVNDKNIGPLPDRKYSYESVESQNNRKSQNIRNDNNEEDSDDMGDLFG